METIGRRGVATDFVRSRFRSWSVSTTVFRDGVKTSFGALFFRSTLRFFCTSVRCQHTASFCSVLKDYQSFVPACILFGVQFGPQHASTMWFVLCRRTEVVNSSIVLCRCLFPGFVLYATHANRALIIDVHVFCTSLQTNTDS